MPINDGFSLSRGTDKKETTDGKIQLEIKIYAQVKSSFLFLYSVANNKKTNTTGWC